MTQKTVLVVGATGYLGGKVVKHLHSKNARIKALVRAESNADALKEQDVDICPGDLTKPNTLAKALSEVDVVISTAIGYSQRRRGDSLKSVDDIGNKNLINAMIKANTARFVFTSVLTADKARSVPHFWQKKLTEDYIKRSNVPSIILRPGAFLDQDLKNDIYAKGLRNGHVKVLGSVSAKWTNILTDDVAEYLAVAATDERIPPGTIDIGMEEPMNAEMLSKYASAYTGKKIKVSAIPWPIIGSVFSLVGIFKSDMKDLKKMFDYFFTGQYVADTSLQNKYFGAVPSVQDSVIRYCRQIALERSRVREKEMELSS